MSIIQAPAKPGVLFMHLRVLLFCVRWGAFLLEVNLDELFIKSVPLP